MSDAYSKTARGKNPIAIGALLAIIMFVLAAPIVADGNSMSPTIDDGNLIVIHKKTYSENRGLPEYGELVAFKRDYYKGEQKGEYIFGRVMGLPGDTISVSEGIITRNGDVVDESSEEYMPKGNTEGEMEVTLDGTEIFILGDNREEAIDSRYKRVEPITMEDIRGRVVLRLWPLNEIGLVK